MDSPGEILNLCRLCLVKDQVNIPIFEEQGDIRQIFLKISSCLPVTITRHDQLPKRICDACSNKLDLLYEFWNSSASAEKTLLSWLGQAGVEDAGEKISAVAQQIAKPAETLVKEESEALDESNLINESRDSFEDQSIDDEGTKDEAEAPPPKRARRTAAVKAQINITPESDEDEDDDFDAGEAMTKMEDESEESESDMKDDPSYSELPGTSADDQAGPSGVGKDGVEAPNEEPNSPAGKTTTNKERLCNECGKNFLSRTGWYMHMRRHAQRKNGLMYTCDVCGLQFFDKNTVELHKRKVHLEDLPFCCEQCGRTFVSQGCLTNHQRTSHRDLKKKFPCPFKECKKTCNTSGTLRYHLKLTHEKKTHQCNVCSKIFHHPLLLRRHVKKHHENNPKPIFPCNFCGMKITTACGLKNHIRTHTGEKPYECQSCGKHFTTSQQLKGHRVVHTKEKPFACKMCPKRFTQRGTLSSHVRSSHQVAETIVKDEHYEVDS